MCTGTRSGRDERPEPTVLIIQVIPHLLAHYFFALAMQFMKGAVSRYEMTHTPPCDRVRG